MALYFPEAQFVPVFLNGCTELPNIDISVKSPGVTIDIERANFDFRFAPKPIGPEPKPTPTPKPTIKPTSMGDVGTNDYSVEPEMVPELDGNDSQPMPMPGIEGDVDPMVAHVQPGFDCYPPDWQIFKHLFCPLSEASDASSDALADINIYGDVNIHIDNTTQPLYMVPPELNQPPQELVPDFVEV